MPNPYLAKVTVEEENLLALQDEFLDSGSWCRSLKGNLMRQWGDLQLTVFRRGDDLYNYCIVDAMEVRYSRLKYEM